jgi:Zn-dependent protease with chaperone function
MTRLRIQCPAALAAVLMAALATVQFAASAQNPFSAIGDAIGGVGGQLVNKTGRVAEKLNEQGPPPQAGPRYEYLVGYRVAARIIGTAKALPVDSAVAKYVDAVGQTVALGSAFPYPYRGYFFVVLESADVNAFATPGGFVFVTTGMVKFLRNEDELAAILGHEVGHVELSHGMRSIQDNRNNKAMGGVMQELASGTVVGDTVGQVLGPLSDEIYKSVANGYSSDLEAEADARSAEICAKLGYDPSALLGVLERFRAYKGNYGGAGYPEERAGLYAGKLQRAQYPVTAPVPERVSRFADALSRLP